MSACEGVWECLGGLWACVRECDCVGVCGHVAGCAHGHCVAACPGHTPSFVKVCGYQLRGFSSPQDLRVYMDNPSSTPASHALLSSSPPTLRAQQSLELQLLSNLTFRCPSLTQCSSASMLWPHGPLRVTSPLGSLPRPPVPLSLSGTCLAKSQPCVNLFPCLPLQLRQ